jgi:hypothetical protein
VIYDHARVRPETVAAAEDIVSVIFRRAGVHLIWREGFEYAAERRAAVNPAPEDAATLVIKLQPASEAGRYGVRSVCGGIGFDSGAIVFVLGFDATRLGYVMTHELGHILLGPNSHALVGIMHPILSQDDWQKAAQGTLDFTRSQKQQIGRWIAQHERARQRSARLPVSSGPTGSICVALNRNFELERALTKSRWSRAAQKDQNCSSRGASIKVGDTAAVQPLCDSLQ